MLTDREDGGEGPQIRIVDVRAVIDRRIGELHEAARVRSQAAGDEAADLIDREIVVRRVVVGNLIVRQAGVCVGERRLHHQRQWYLAGPALPAGLGIAADLEGATEGGEL